MEGTHEPNLPVILRQMVMAVTLLVTGKLSRISGNPSRNLGSPTKVRGRKELSRPKMNTGRGTKRARTLWCTKGNRESLGPSPPSSCHAGHILSKGVGLVASANTHIPVLRLYLMMITTASFIWRARWPTSGTSSSCGVCLNPTGSMLSMNVKWQMLMTLNHVASKELVGRSGLQRSKFDSECFRLVE